MQLVLFGGAVTTNPLCCSSICLIWPKLKWKQCCFKLKSNFGLLDIRMAPLDLWHCGENYFESTVSLNSHLCQTCWEIPKEFWDKGSWYLDLLPHVLCSLEKGRLGSGVSVRIPWPGFWCSALGLRSVVWDKDIVERAHRQQGRRWVSCPSDLTHAVLLQTVPIRISSQESWLLTRYRYKGSKCVYVTFFFF